MSVSVVSEPPGVSIVIVRGGGCRWGPWRWLGATYSLWRLPGWRGAHGTACCGSIGSAPLRGGRLQRSSRTAGELVLLQGIRAGSDQAEYAADGCSVTMLSFLLCGQLAGLHGGGSRGCAGEWQCGHDLVRWAREQDDRCGAGHRRRAGGWVLQGARQVGGDEGCIRVMEHTARLRVL